jgi:hypothetical protein
VRIRLARRAPASVSVGAAAGILAAASAPNVLAQFKPDGFVDLMLGAGFDSAKVSPDDLESFLKDNTILDGDTLKSGRMIIVYGIGVGGGGGVIGPFVSIPVNLVPGKKPFIGLGEGPIGSPWDAFEVPLAGFEVPLAGFEVPLAGFDGDIEDFEVPLAGFASPMDGLEAIWGTGGVAIPKGIHGLIMLTMPDPSITGSGVIAHRAVIVQFKVIDGAG